MEEEELKKYYVYICRVFNFHIRKILYKLHNNELLTYAEKSLLSALEEYDFLLEDLERN